MLYQEFSETTPRRPVLGPGVRLFGLHTFGAVCAIALLVTGIYLVSRYGPYDKVFNGFTAAFGLVNEDEPAAASAEVVVPSKEAPAPVAAVVRRRVFRAPVSTKRVFTPPPAVETPHPQMMDELPAMAAVAIEPTFISLPEYALPPKPRNAVVKVLAALSYPFRFLGGVFGGRRSDHDYRYDGED